MGRPKDEHYWNQVTREVNGMLKCKHCGHKFKGGVSRIKAHVDRKQGQGIRPCSIDPGSVRNNEGVDNNNVVGSSNPQGVVNAMNSSQEAGGAHQMIVVETDLIGSWNHQNDTEFSNLLEGCTVPAVYAMMGSGNIGVESQISDLKQSVHDLTCEEDDIKEQLQLLESCGKKRKRQVDDWLNKVGVLKERARREIELAGQGESTCLSELDEEIQQLTKEKPLVLSNELVGRSFEENIKEVWELLGDDKVFKIGIHGMGGVGKTCLVTHIKEEIIRKSTFNFKHVFWVTVSQHFSIFELQNVIAKRIGVKLDEDDERMRAEILSSELVKKDKSLFILDNIWNHVDLQKVGIPLRVKGNKLILTSRLKHVCRQMDCHIIRMQLLSGPYMIRGQLLCKDYGFQGDNDYEDWVLFLLKLRFHGIPSTFSPKVLEIARSVANECEGLPLGINVMARTLKGVNDIHSWRHALNKLRNSKIEEMEEEVFKILKLSYDNLIDITMQKYFLYCALFQIIDKSKLIMNLVEEGLIKGMRSLEEIFDEGRAILDKLVDHSLLLEGTRYYLWMHNLMSGIARHNILEVSGRYMVKCNEGLKKIPDMEEWTTNLEKVSLAQNNIQQIPEDTSPCCPRLSTLIFCRNLLKCIPDCFFSHMNALAILDLSYNNNLESLPNSVANLRSLISLLLKGCMSLKNVPPLGQLQKLSRLIISETSIKEVPQGLETLINLKWLDLSENYDLTLVPGFVLPSLTNMQYLDLRSQKVKVKAEDVQGMSMLEYFAGCFHDCNNYNDYVSKTVDKDCGPKTYHILSEIDICSIPELHIEEQTKHVTLGDCGEFTHLLPRGLTTLDTLYNKQWRCLCDALPFKFNGPSSLSCIRIVDCTKLESLFCLSASRSLCTHLLDIESLPQDGVFYHLKSLGIWRCHKMEKLLTPGSLKQLQNLESLAVSNCNSMKKIFAVRSNEDDDDDYSTITLPKLTNLTLFNLPLLKTVCKGILVCGSSKVLSIYGCPYLEKPKVQAISDSVSNPHEAY